MYNIALSRQAVFTNYPEWAPTEQTPTEMEYMVAARSGDLEAVKRAIEANVDVNYRQESRLYIVHTFLNFIHNIM